MKTVAPPIETETLRVERVTFHDLGWIGYRFPDGSWYDRGEVGFYVVPDSRRTEKLYKERLAERDAHRRSGP